MNDIEGADLSGLLGVILDRFRQVRWDMALERMEELAERETKPAAIPPVLFWTMLEHAAWPDKDDEWFHRAIGIRRQVNELVQRDLSLMSYLDFWSQLISRLKKDRLVEGREKDSMAMAGFQADGINLENAASL